MNESSVARRYARAIFELAVEEGQFEQVGQELATVRAVIEADPDVLWALGNPAISREEKQQLVETLIGALQPTPTVANALRLIADRGRLAVIPQIEQDYRRLADERAGRLRARVTSAVPLSDESAARIGQALTQATRRNVVVERRVDPSILGGVVTQVGSMVYDGSLKSQLEQLKKQLKA